MIAARVIGFISEKFGPEPDKSGFDIEWIRPAKAAATITKTYPKLGEKISLFLWVLNILNTSHCYFHNWK